MDSLIHRAPTVGRTVKKVIAINPLLTVNQVIEIIRECIEQQDNSGMDFVTAEVINEPKALRLAQETVGKLSSAG